MLKPIQDLTILSLEDLADRYAQIDQQSQLMKGLILLEARNRFVSNNEFGDWVKTVQSLCLDRQEVRTRYMNFARYFKDRDMEGISLTVAYEISAPVNQEIADIVYEYVKGKNLKVAEVKEKVAEFKIRAGIDLISTRNKKEQLPVALSGEKNVYQDNDELVAISYGNGNNKQTIQIESFYLYALQRIGVADVSQWLFDVIGVDDKNRIGTSKKVRHTIIRTFLDLENKVFSPDSFIIEYIKLLQALKKNSSNDKLKEFIGGIRGATDRFDIDVLQNNLDEECILDGGCIK